MTNYGSHGVVFPYLPHFEGRGIGIQGQHLFLFALAFVPSHRAIVLPHKGIKMDLRKTEQVAEENRSHIIIDLPTVVPVAQCQISIYILHI